MFPPLSSTSPLVAFAIFTELLVAPLPELSAGIRPLKVWRRVMRATV